ncbi:hypothetical protein N7461_002199 [Penicillium sp. DV-2018c]|nr:hypothetical protein N7461_002199 [Penicillium sp. DV-2018c]
MCKHTYHHYPSCGHISNWSMTSCQEYTNELRLAGPGRSVACTNITASHDLLLLSQPSMCVQCESEWAESLYRENLGTKVRRSYRTIEGLDVTGQLIRLDARMVSGPCGRDTGGTDYDSTQVFLDAAKLEKEREKKTADAIAELSRRNLTLDEKNARIRDWKKATSGSIIDADLVSSGYESVETDLPDTEETSETHSVSSDYERVETDLLDAQETPETPGENCSESSDCASLCGSALLEYHILNLRIDEYSRQWELEAKIQKNINVDDDDDDNETFNIDEYILPVVDDRIDTTENTPINQPETQEEEPNSPTNTIDIDLLQQRIEATIRKRIEENNSQQTSLKLISTLLDRALLQKDRTERLERDAEQGIEEDPHLWDTESDTEFVADHTVLNPTTMTYGNYAPNRAPPEPVMNAYIESEHVSPDSDLQARIRGLHPGHNAGSSEGSPYMWAFSASDARRTVLQDPWHVRGRSASRPAPFRYFHGMLHASSESERRGLEDISHVVRRREQLYGPLRADDEEPAWAMGLREIRHPLGSFVEEDFVRARSESGPIGEADDCESNVHGVIEVAEGVKCEIEGKSPEMSISGLQGQGLHGYYGYMYAKSEEEVVNRGLRDVLLVPGFDIKYSGYVRASSEEEAKAMGLFEPARIEWSGNRPWSRPEGFLGS